MIINHKSYLFKRINHYYSRNTTTDWWFHHWDDDSQYMEKLKMLQTTNQHSILSRQDLAMDRMGFFLFFPVQMTYSINGR